MHPFTSILCLSALTLGLPSATHVHSGDHSEQVISQDALTEAAVTVACTLENGLESECLQVKL